jgi:hypothetical protein
METNTFKTMVNRAARVIGVGCIAGCALSAPACGGLPDEDGTDVVTETDPIINGTTLTSDTIGTPIYNAAQQCSATMIRKDWMLTAQHCLRWPDGRLNNPGDVLAGMVNHAPTQPGVRIVRHPSLDVALVQLAGPLTDNSGQSFTNPIYVGPASSLVSKPVYIQGWGDNVITSCTPEGGSGTGSVVLRSMTAAVNQLPNPKEYKILPNFPAGQIPFKGDSGSTPFTTVNGFRRPTGVSAYVHCDINPLRVTDAFFVRSDAFRGWLQGVVGTGITGGRISGFERPDKATVIAYTEGSPAHIKLLAKGSPTTPDWTLTDLGGSTRSGTDVPSYVRGDGTAAVLYVNSSNHIVEIRPGFNGTWISTDLTADAGGSNVSLAAGHIAAYVRGDNLATGESVTSVVYGSSDGNIRELRWSPGAAHWTSALLTSPGSPSGGNPVGYVRGDGVNTVVYVDTSGHIQELAQFNGWIRTDLTGFLGVPTVAGGATVHVYTRSDGYSIVLYRDGAQDIWELAMNSNGGWSAANLTSQFGCAKTTTDPYGYVRPDGINAVVFRDPDSHVHELSLDGTWLCNDLSAATGAPDISFIGPYAFVGSDLHSHVVYRSADGHVRDLVLNVQWVATDPTQVAGGP